MKIRRLWLSIFCCLGLLALARDANPAVITKPLVVMIDRDASGFVYKVDSVVVTKGLLYTLTFLEGKHSESILLVHEDAKISMLTDVYGIINKAGYINPTIFYFDRHKQWMAGLTLSTVVRFSAEGDVADSKR